MASMSTKDRVSRIQMSTDSGCDGFLSNVRVTGSVDQASLVAPSQFFFGVPNDQHGAKERGQMFVRHAAWLSSAGRRGTALHRQQEVGMAGV